MDAKPWSALVGAWCAVLTVSCGISSGPDRADEWPFALTPGHGSGTTYYVAPTGSDNNPGSASAPFASLQKAANVVNPGDAVVVRDGTYRAAPGSPYVVLQQRGGTANAWVTFQAEHPGAAIVDGQGFRTPYCWGFQHTANYVRVQGFNVGFCANAAFWNNDSSHDLYFYKNIIHNIGQVYSCDTSGKAGGFSGFGTARTTYDSNLIHDIGRLHQTCIINGQPDPWLTYTNDHGLYLYGNANTVINNVFYNCSSGWELQIAGGSAATDGPNWVIANNTFGPGNNPKTMGEIVIFTAGGGHAPSSVTLENNIAYQPAGGSFINNVYYPGNSSYVVRNNLVSSGTLISTGTNPPPEVSESNNVEGKDPLFVNPAAFDYHLTAASPAIGSGTAALAPPYDFDGNSVTGAFSIGAFFRTASPVAAATLNPSSVNFGSEPVGGTSAVQYITVKSTGTAALTLTQSFKLTGDFIFGGSGTCGLQSYAPGTSCTVSLKFVPAGRGVRSGSVTLYDNAGTGWQTASLVGTGT